MTTNLKSLPDLNRVADAPPKIKGKSQVKNIYAFYKEKYPAINKIWLVNKNKMAAACNPGGLSVSSHTNAKGTYSGCISNLRGHENSLILKLVQQISPLMFRMC